MNSNCSIFGFRQPIARHSPAQYMKSRDFKLKNRLRAFLINANAMIMDSTTISVGAACASLPIPEELRSVIKMKETEFLIRKDFMQLCATMNIKIKKITAKLNTGKPTELCHTIQIHLESHGIEPEEPIYDLGIALEFALMPLCGIPNLLINSQLIEHINAVILERFLELE